MRASLLRVATIISALLLAPSIAAAAQSGADGLIERFVQAWNAHDMKAFEALYTADATWVPTFDVRHEGRDAIVADLRKAHEGWAKSSTLEASKPLVKSLHSGVATVQFNVMMMMGRQDQAPIGRTLLLVASKEAGDWKIVAGQLTKPNCPRPASEPRARDSRIDCARSLRAHDARSAQKNHKKSAQVLTVVIYS